MSPLTPDRLVTVRVTGSIALIVIDNPPVSTGNARLRKDLYAACQEVGTFSHIAAVVLYSTQSHFYSGSDISEFDGEISFPSLPDVVTAIEQISVPVVAALNGMTLGGGLELAMACDARIAAATAQVGLPEVKLGIIPGAGGTVRLPRLVGVPFAIEMIATGNPISAQVAYDHGLVDAITAPEDLLSTSCDIAPTLSKRQTLLLPVGPISTDTIEMTRRSVLKPGKTRPNVEAAIDLIIEGAEGEGPSALVAERTVFDRLRVSAEARNLRYLFFAKRLAVKDLSRLARAHVPKTVGVVGAGTMGSKIATAFLEKGMDVVVAEVSETTRELAQQSISNQAMQGRNWGVPQFTDSLLDLRRCDLVIDAVFEDRTVKRSVLQGLEEVLPDVTVIASNTSYLDLNELAADLEYPERFIGIHFFNPADKNLLLEVVQTDSSNGAALAMAAGVARLLGKSPILAQVGDGFVANRVYADYRSQAEFLVEDGASPRQVDDAMRALGLPIGPFAVSDMSGLDIAWARRKRLAHKRNQNQRYVTIADELCERGRLGKKKGAGWYRYDVDNPRGSDDAEVTEIIRVARAAKGISPRAFTHEQIQRRIICSMVAAAVALITAGVAQRESDIDVAMTVGFGFPTWLGGPLRFASDQSEHWLVTGLAEVYESDNIGFAVLAEAAEGAVPVAVAKLLQGLAR